MSERKVRLQAARAIYSDGTLVFADPALAPSGVTEVLVTYAEEAKAEARRESDAIKFLRGRGKGERLTEKLLKSRREDREHDERSPGHLRP